VASLAQENLATENVRNKPIEQDKQSQLMVDFANHDSAERFELR